MELRLNRYCIFGNIFYSICGNDNHCIQYAPSPQCGASIRETKSCFELALDGRDRKLMTGFKNFRYSDISIFEKFDKHSRGKPYGC
jgi:hypothetical protein